MFESYLKVAIRNLKKNKLYSVVNILGMTIGFICFILIFLYVDHELSYDKYHSKSKNVYRLALETEASKGTQRNAQTPASWSKFLKANFPEVTNVVRFKPPRSVWLVGYPDKDTKFSEKRWTFADSTALEIFDIPLTKGNEKFALNRPNQVVLSQSMSEKYFPEEDPIGKVLILDNQYSFQVSGVMEDLPAHSHFHYDFLASFTTLLQDTTKYYRFDIENSHFPFVYTYLELNGNPKNLENQFPAFVERFVPERFRPEGVKLDPFLQPIKDIHLASNLENEIEANGNLDTVYILFFIGLFILLISIINFINLSTAQYAKRVKEIGLRQVMGAQRQHLIHQFLAESVVICLIALICAFVLSLLALPAFNQLSEKAFTSFQLISGSYLILFTAIAIATGLLAGFYPAFVISGLNTTSALKGTTQIGGGLQKSFIRKFLIAFQFTISIFMIIGTLIVYQQLDYVQNKNLGIAKDQILVVSLTDRIPIERFPTFKKAIEQNLNIQGVSSSFSTPGGVVFESQAQTREAAPGESWQVQVFPRGYDFVSTLGMELLLGRDISKEFPSDSTDAILINEAAMETFGWTLESVLNKELKIIGNGPGNNEYKKVIGVVKDFHSKSMREKIPPTVLAYNATAGFSAFVNIKSDIESTIPWIRERWDEVVPGYPFSYSMMSQDFDELYSAETSLKNLLSYFTFLTIIIACLGLIGLTSYTIHQKVKEIALRKALGSSITGILVLLSKDFIVLCSIAFLIGAPIAFAISNWWLNTFTYRIDFSILPFMLTLVLILIISLITISFQTVKAAKTNPIKGLRSE